MVALPSVSARTVNGALVYLLVAISFMCHELLQQSNWKKHVVTLVAFIALIYFGVSYVLIFKSYRSLSEQAAYRDNLVIAAVRAGAEKIEIPAFYRGRLLKWLDGPDPYFPGHAMARHFRTSATITDYEVTGRYGPGSPPVRRE